MSCRNVREEENLRQCEQLISELQAEMPPERGYQTQRVGSNSSRRQNPANHSAAFPNSNSMMLKNSGSLSSLRVSICASYDHPEIIEVTRLQHRLRGQKPEQHIEREPNDCVQQFLLDHGRQKGYAIKI